MEDRDIMTLIKEASGKGQDAEAFVSACADVSAYQGGATVVDGYVIDDGYEIECHVEARLVYDGIALLSLSGDSQELPTDKQMYHLAPQIVPYGHTRKVHLEKRAESDIPEFFANALKNPLDYVSDTSKLEAFIREEISDETKNLAEDELGIAIEWE